MRGRAEGIFCYMIMLCSDIILYDVLCCVHIVLRMMWYAVCLYFMVHNFVFE